ncbi:MRPL51 [[Candida] subhashii]|uniref:MRPL51 n=1 Tax=[Candida] subhashii TaxID=561895 RepID=A0A8J5QX42_9ASCO|nr:MRPL51 [[Candida] subhashii]KAG7666322.1 MRPL51 [[Candida] subhashii]
MPIKAIPKLSVARNGVGAFVNPCYKVIVQYCNWGGSSQGLRDVLANKQLGKIADQHKGTVFEVTKRSGSPKLIFHYNNKTQQTVDVARLNEGEVVDKINDYIRRSGNNLFKCNHKVISNNDSVRGIWSPLYTPKGHRFKI